MKNLKSAINKTVLTMAFAAFAHSSIPARGGNAEHDNLLQSSSADNTRVGANGGLNLVINGDAEGGSIHPWSGVAMEMGDVYEGGRSFSVNNRVPAINQTPIEVDSEQNYELSGWFRSAGPEASNLNFGLVCLDAAQELIRGPEVTFIEGTETVLTGDAPMGSRVLKISDGSTWQIEPKILAASHVAFDIDDSGELTDLPNRNLSGRGLARVQRSGGDWEIELTQPLEKTYSAGTKIRQHRQAQSYLYIMTDRPIPEEWTHFSGKVGGLKANTPGVRPFWPGTRYVKVVIFPLDPKVHENDARLLFDNIEFGPKQ